MWKRRRSVGKGAERKSGQQGEGAWLRDERLCSIFQSSFVSLVHSFARSVDPF